MDDELMSEDEEAFSFRSEPSRPKQTLFEKSVGYALIFGMITFAAHFYKMELPFLERKHPDSYYISRIDSYHAKAHDEERTSALTQLNDETESFGAIPAGFTRERSLGVCVNEGMLRYQNHDKIISTLNYVDGVAIYFPVTTGETSADILNEKQEYLGENLADDGLESLLSNMPSDSKVFMGINLTGDMPFSVIKYGYDAVLDYNASHDRNLSGLVVNARTHFSGHDDDRGFKSDILTYIASLQDPKDDLEVRLSFMMIPKSTEGLDVSGILPGAVTSLHYYQF